MTVTRRRFISGATAATLGAGVSIALFDRSLVSVAASVSADGRYGPLGTPDINSIRLPDGFTSRLLARAQQPVAGTEFMWRSSPDGGACFAHADGGWIYVVNHELDSSQGGVSALRFDQGGAVADAYSILSGTSRNCSGGPTPWNTYLSCEENVVGQVWECDPFSPGEGVVRPLLGTFNHEAAAVDPKTGNVYLTEDAPAGRLYRFRPAVPGRLDAGLLEAASVDLENIETENAMITWHPASIDAPDRSVNTTAFRGGEGAWVHAGRLLFTTKSDRRVWDLTLDTQMLRLVHDCRAHPTLELDAVDAIAVHDPSGDIFVTEDGGNNQLGLIEERDGSTVAVSAFLEFVGHEGSEVTGVAFNPAGDRLYVSSQRGIDGAGVGVTFEIAGPFEVSRVLSGVRLDGLQPAQRLG